MPIKIRSIWDHAGFQKYFQNTGWMFAGQMTMIISLFINIWIARHLGPANFGSLSYIFAFAGIFGFIASLGIQDILVRDLVRYPEQREKIIGTCMRLLAGGGLAAFAITALATLLVNGLSLISLLIILYATIFLWSPLQVIPAYFQSVVQAKQNALVQIIGTIISSALKIYFISIGAGIIWLTLAFALDVFLISLLYVWTYKRVGLDFIRWTFDWAFAKRLLRASYLLMFAAGFAYATLKIDQVLIKFFLDEASLGFYAAAVKISEVWYFIPAIICASLFPAIINAKTADEDIYRGRLKRLSVFLLAVAVLIALFITALASWIVPLLYGDIYAPAISIAQIHVWSSVGYFLMIAATKYLMAENRLREIAVYSAVAAAANILLNIALIPTLGLAGAAIASIISYAIFPVLAFARKAPPASS